MGTALILSVLCQSASAGVAPPPDQAAAVRRPQPSLHAVPSSDVTLREGFWLGRVRTNRASLLAGHRELEANGGFRNFRIAAGMEEGEHSVYVFTDSDCYKWLEAACIQLQHGDDEELRRLIDGFVPLILAAQEEDGYLMTKYQVEGTQRWTRLDHGHELYCHGHLFQAAIAHRRATGETRLLDAAVRLADLICATFPEEREGAPGHPEIEMALVALAQETGDARYLEQAGYFLDRRGLEPPVAGGSEYMQDHAPLREQSAAVGHAVRALYLYAGAADHYLASGDASWPPVLERLWRDIYRSKVYVTGGIGARHDGEALGAAYELPNERAYSETCAAIASMLFNRRMLAITGRPVHGDLMETTLYNNILAGVSADGEGFFYVNPLESRGGHRRQSWYACACCPPNIMRTVAGIDGDAFLARGEQLFVNLFLDCEVDTLLPSGTRAHFQVETTLPWGGKLRIEPLPGNQCTRLRLRMPGWYAGVDFPPEWRERMDTALAAPEGWADFVLHHSREALELGFRLPVVALEAHPALLENRGHVAFRRGPLVYAFESVDHPEVPVLDAQVVIDPSAESYGWRSAPLRTGAGSWVALHGPGRVIVHDAAGPDRSLYRPAGRSRRHGRAVELTAIPYFAWANRGDSRMRVWMPVAAQ